MNEQICKCGARLEAFRYSSHSTKHYWAKVGTGEVCINDHWHEPAEPSPEPEAAPDTSQNSPETWDRPDLDYPRAPGISADRDRESDAQSGNPWYPTDEPHLAVHSEAAPASEAQAPAVPDERPKCPDCNSVGMSHCSDPEHCGGVYWPDSKYQALRAELAQLRARVAILDAQKVDLPEKWRKKSERAKFVHKSMGVVPFLTADESIELFNRLLDALRAVQAYREVARQFVDTLRTPDPKMITCDHDRLTAAIAAYDALAGKGE